MNDVNTYRRGRHVVSDMKAHLVFVTKYRRGVLSDRAIAVLRESMAKVCVDFDAHLEEMNGEDDHVHLLVSYPPTVAISVLVNSLKGVSSRMLRKQQFPEVTSRLWGGSLWSPSYFVVSCGGAPLDVIRQYIEDQRVPGPKKTGPKPGQKFEKRKKEGSYPRPKGRGLRSNGS